MRIALLLTLLLATGACATGELKARPEARDAIARAQPLIDKLVQYRSRRGHFPVALSDVGEIGQDYDYQPHLGGESYILSFDFSLSPQIVRCTRTLERDWACTRR